MHCCSVDAGGSSLNVTIEFFKTLNAGTYLVLGTVRYDKDMYGSRYCDLKYLLSVNNRDDMYYIMIIIACAHCQTLYLIPVPL